jgi:hypothetical protein
MKKKFVFVLRKPDGIEYEKVISAENVVDAEQRLKDALEIFDSRDEVVRLEQE